MKTTKIEMQVYSILGKTLCACAGGIVGLVLAGPILAIAGIFTGALCGHLFERSITRCNSFSI